MDDKKYIGDSVYAQKDGNGGVWLTTENGPPTDPSNKIFLEPQVIHELLRLVLKPTSFKRLMDGAHLDD